MLELTNIVNNLIILISKFVKWITSSDSSGLLTLFTGLTALVVYWHQNKLRLKEASIILLSEISNAETGLEIIQNIPKETVFQIHISILPTCSWEKYYHLFAKKLHKDEFDLLNSFFWNCSAAQKEFMKSSEKFSDIAMKAKAEKLQDIIINLAERNKETPNQYEQERDALLTIAHKETYLFAPHKPAKAFFKYVDNIPQIIGTTAWQKLEKFSR